MKKQVPAPTSCQDGGIGKRGLPPHTTTAKLQLNYRTSIIQNHQKIKLYGGLATKELKIHLHPEG